MLLDPKWWTTYIYRYWCECENSGEVSSKTEPSLHGLARWSLRLPQWHGLGKPKEIGISSKTCEWPWNVAQQCDWNSVGQETLLPSKPRSCGLVRTQEDAGSLSVDGSGTANLLCSLNLWQLSSGCSEDKEKEALGGRVTRSGPSKVAGKNHMLVSRGLWHLAQCYEDDVLMGTRLFMIQQLWDLWAVPFGSDYQETGGAPKNACVDY